MNNDFKVMMRRKPDEKLVTVRHVSHTTHTPIEIVKRHLEQSGKFEDKYYIIRMPASHIEVEEDANSASPITNPVIPPWRRK
jgi:hypothetical protein